MAHNTEGPAISIRRSPAAARMRLHRERRRHGLRCLMIELRETEIDVLIGKGLLNSEMPRNIANAAVKARAKKLPLVDQHTASSRYAASAASNLRARSTLLCLRLQ